MVVLGLRHLIDWFGCCLTVNVVQVTLDPVSADGLLESVRMNSLLIVGEGQALV